MKTVTATRGAFETGGAIAATHVREDTGVIPLHELLGQSGLDFLAGIGAGRYPMPPMSEVIPVRPIEVEEGRIVFESEPDERFYNTIGTVHGGYAATLLDTAMGCAVHSSLRPGEGYTTLELKVSFVRAMTAHTGPVRIEGTLVHRSRRTATATGEIRDAAGRLLAHGSTTCLVFDPMEGRKESGQKAKDFGLIGVATPDGRTPS